MTSSFDLFHGSEFTRRTFRLFFVERIRENIEHSEIVTMSEELQEYPMQASVKSTMDGTTNYPPLISDSATENTTQFYVGSVMLLKKLAAFSLVLGIVVAVGALSVIEYFPSPNPKLALDTNKGRIS